MSNPSIKRVYGPAYLSATTTTNVYNQSSALIFDVVKHIHIANTTASPATASLWLSSTGDNTGGKELFKGLVIAANTNYDYYCNLKMLSTDFLVGGSGTGSALVITIESEQYVV